ncbi:MAG TPA: hypothetical protein VFO38_00065 [Candidatus Saccharimonadales bacterium]|nr:hypothetical protein [Candidatus Saccharimonadales bacterium]
MTQQGGVMYPSTEQHKRITKATIAPLGNEPLDDFAQNWKKDGWSAGLTLGSLVWIGGGITFFWLFSGQLGSPSSNEIGQWIFMVLLISFGSSASAGAIVGLLIYWLVESFSERKYERLLAEKKILEVHPLLLEQWRQALDRHQLKWGRERQRTELRRMFEFISDQEELVASIEHPRTSAENKQALTEQLANRVNAEVELLAIPIQEEQRAEQVADAAFTEAHNFSVGTRFGLTDN